LNRGSLVKKKISERYLPWNEARRRFHISHAHIQMARELGMNPKKFGGLANTKQEPWKLPSPEYVEELLSVPALQEVTAPARTLHRADSP
jgi:hypothetical protein